MSDIPLVYEFMATELFCASMLDVDLLTTVSNTSQWTQSLLASGPEVEKSMFLIYIAQYPDMDWNA